MKDLENKLRWMLENKDNLPKQPPQITVELAFDPWQNESIEWDLSEDPDMAIKALGVDVDAQEYAQLIESRGGRVQKTVITVERHTGTSWRMWADFDLPNYRRYTMWRHPYVVVVKETEY